MTTPPKIPNTPITRTSSSLQSRYSTIYDEAHNIARNSSLYVNGPSRLTKALTYRAAKHKVTTTHLSESVQGYSIESQTIDWSTAAPQSSETSTPYLGYRAVHGFETKSLVCRGRRIRA